MNPEGTGLGLYISKLLIDQLGPKNSIQVYSKEGFGATFIFQLYYDCNQKELLDQTAIDINLPFIEEDQIDVNVDEAIDVQQIKIYTFIGSDSPKSPMKKQSFVCSSLLISANQKLNILKEQFS